MFERSNQLSLDEVCDKLDQPREPAKKALEEICNYDKRSGMYTLKDKFQQKLH